MHEARLAPQQLRNRFDPTQLGFESTEEVEPLEGTIGQPRAAEAIEFALGVTTPGYNVFATGPVGTGKRSMLEASLRDHAARRDPPGDWVYLFNFDAPERPVSVRLPTGRGRELWREMGRFVEEARRQMWRAFESEEYERRRRELTEDEEQRRNEVLGELREFARERGFALELTPAGILSIPVVEGKPVLPRDFAALPAEVREEFENRGEEVEARMPAVVQRIRALEREGREKARELDREVALFAVGHIIEELKDRFEGLPAIFAWLDQVREDVIENLSRFRGGDEGEAQVPEPIAAGLRQAREEFFGRYEPNVLISHGGADGAPVVVETSPTYYNLFGRIEFEAALGAVTTDHRHIKPGALHRANGGYLLLQAVDVLAEPFVWPRLKEALRTRRARVENIGAQLTLFPTATLEPEPIELDLKVVLVGSPRIYTLLYLLDEDVRKLFKVKADFDVEVPWEEEQAVRYAAFISRQAREEGLRHFDRGAVARMLEFGARAAGHQRRLSTRFIDIADLAAEASHWAARAGSELVRPEHVDEAVERKTYRSNLLEEKLRELIAEGTLLVDLEGERVGQVNGIAVAVLGDYEFGRPTRITATTAVGDGNVVNLDRETELSGRVHDKGFLILAGFLQERYGGERPLSLNASLTFEQSYEEIEGDSASGAELFALLSSLADTPIRQGIAVTGSINQHGRMQAVGGVNEKVEGFYFVCKQRGLRGSEGVVLPAANVKHLMLRDEVVEAVRDGSFNVWTADSVDQAIEILTGVPGGERGPDGAYPEGTINRRVEDRIAELAEAARRFRRPAEDGRPPTA